MSKDARYRLIRFYFSAGIRQRVLDTGLTLSQVQKHCGDPESSSTTATSATARRRTRNVGPWFDGYEKM